MIQNPQRPVSSIAFPILIALSISHCLNDLLQSVITATYPLFKDDLALSFAQIGLITLVYQMSASVFQPVFGLFFDKRPVAWTLPAGMLFTMTGMLNLAFASNLHWVLLSVFLIGIGSSVLHPEASRITSLASGGRRGLAQSLFQSEGRGHEDRLRARDPPRHDPRGNGRGRGRKRRLPPQDVQQHLHE